MFVAVIRSVHVSLSLVYVCALVKSWPTSGRSGVSVGVTLKRLGVHQRVHPLHSGRLRPVPGARTTARSCRLTWRSCVRWSLTCCSPGPTSMPAARSTRCGRYGERSIHPLWSVRGADPGQFRALWSGFFCPKKCVDGICWCLEWCKYGNFQCNLPS